VAGDARITVTGFDEANGVAVVEVTLAGVDDPEGVLGFTLVGSGATAAPTGGAAEPCTGFTVDPVQCTLTFPTVAMQTGDRLLVFKRADQSARWKLT
jgi:hypothetical protein